MYKKKQAASYSPGDGLQYHRRRSVLLPCSGWERVFPLLYDHLQIQREDEVRLLTESIYSKIDNQIKKLATTYSPGDELQYHRRRSVLLPCSGWERVFPLLYDHLQIQREDEVRLLTESIYSKIDNQIKKLATTYSPGDELQYHRRRSVLLPCSGWERVFPLLYGHQQTT